MYCVYPAMSKKSENLSDLNKKDSNKRHSSPFINVVKGVFFVVRVTLVPVSYLSAPSAVTQLQGTSKVYSQAEKFIRIVQKFIRLGRIKQKCIRIAYLYSTCTESLLYSQGKHISFKGIRYDQLSFCFKQASSQWLAYDKHLIDTLVFNRRKARCN